MAEALGNGNEVSGAALIRGILILIPQIPGYFILVAVCAGLRSSCYKGQPLGTDQADFIIILLGNATVYMVITYGFAKGIHTRITKATKTRQQRFFFAGILILFSNSILTAWMIWAKKPYYVYPLPGLSILSLVLAVSTLLPLFWGTRHEIAQRSS